MDGLSSELAAAREAVVHVGELKASIAEAKAKEEALRVETASLKTALKVIMVLFGRYGMCVLYMCSHYQ